MGFAANPEVQVIVPARNEQDCIAGCLQSLVDQQGIGFQITVVDDGSTDNTRRIAESFPGVRVISSEEIIPGATGKCNAVIAGARGANAEWLLFTDADTVHHPGSLAATVEEARTRRVDLFSLSPDQATVTWSERILMPVVFAELARTYPPARVNDPANGTVAANGQYILVRRTTYKKLGGHAAIADKILEDVELARLFKHTGCRIWFRHGASLVSTRMYRNFSALIDGWTKNLALLFRHPALLAVIRGAEFAVILGASLIGGALIARDSYSGFIWLAVALLFYMNFTIRIRAAHFSWGSNLLAFWGLPLFSFLLLRSYVQSHIRGVVTWKGRTYRPSASNPRTNSSI